MSKVQMLRCLVNQRLTDGRFERTIAEYEEELSYLKEQNEPQCKLLDAVFNPQLLLHRADVQQLLVVKEEVPPEQQEWSSSLDQEDPEPPHIKEEQEDPEPPHIKEEQEDPEPPHIKEEQFSFTPVKSEEEAQSSQLHQSQTEQMLMERTVEDQNQTGTQIQIDIQNQILMTRRETLLTLMIGRRPENLSQV